jgi:hypothetical protein
MTTIINADTSNGLKLTSDTSGEIALQSAGTTIATVDSTGIAMASGKTLTTNAPAFSATPSADQTLSSATWTTIAFNTEVYDTNSNYNTGTYAFTPTVAGYYNFTAVIRSDAATTRFYTSFTKNATTEYYGNDFNFAASSLNSNFSALIYMNGSTDSVVARAFMQGGGGLTTGSGIMRFSAFLARAA